jgi:septal ring factor EnvC (AmiA/AmiB activator)
MIRDVGSSLARHGALIALVFVTGLSSALAQQVERVKPVEQAGHVAEPPPNVSELTSRPIGERLTDYETMELHLRRYSAAANNAAQLFKQLNQKIQEVSLAAKTVEAKNNTHNRRLLEEKLRQLENMRASFSGQHAQLQSQMQNEYRSYAMLSSNLKVKYDTLQELQTKVDSAKAVKEAKEAKEAQSTKGKQTKPKDPAAKEGKDTKANEPQTRQDLQGTNTGSSAKPAPGSVAGPTLHTIR